MRRVRVTAEASQELQEAADWYEGETRGLGFRLIDAFEHAIELLRDDFPPLTPVPGDAGDRGAKRLMLHRFPLFRHYNRAQGRVCGLGARSPFPPSRLLEGPTTHITPQISRAVFWRRLDLPGYVFFALSGKRSGCAMICSVKSTSRSGQ